MGLGGRDGVVHGGPAAARRRHRDITAAGECASFRAPCSLLGTDSCTYRSATADCSPVHWVCR
jgi:hypothetical protein